MNCCRITDKSIIIIVLLSKRSIITKKTANSFLRKFTPMRLLLYQPEIAQNVGTILRMCACFEIHVDIIGPCGFVFDDKKLRRSSMDYIDLCTYSLFDSWTHYEQEVLNFYKHKRLIVTTPRAETYHHCFDFQEIDIIMFGCESSGLPDEILQLSNHKISIPMASQARSLNIAMASGIVLSAALQKIGRFDQLLNIGGQT